MGNAPLVIGVDPGSSGAIGFLTMDGSEAWTIRLSKLSPSELARELETYRDRIVRAYLEKVHSTPQMGVSSAFTFGRAYGLAWGILTGLKIPTADVSPQAWRKAVGLATVGKGLLGGQTDRKRQSRAKSEAMFPKWKFVDEDGDCLLIAEYGRRQFLNAEMNQMYADRTLTTLTRKQ